MASSITTNTGLFSGLDYEALANALVARQTNIVTRYTAQQTVANAQKEGLAGLEVATLSFATTVTALQQKANFQNVKVTNPAADSITVTAEPSAITGSLRLQSIKTASAHQTVSRGFADTTRTVGTGQIVIANGGGLHTTTLLETLNDGGGVRRGKIQLTDRSGVSVTVDLSKTVSIDDVLDAINNQTTASIKASTHDGKLVLEDTSGGSGEMKVVDLNGGKTAVDLGIKKTSATSTLIGDTVYQTTENTSLSLINDGNPLALNTLTDDLEFKTADGSSFKVNLDSNKSLRDVINSINNATGNSGKVAASIVDGRLKLTDSTTGADTFSVSNTEGSHATDGLGLTGIVANGNDITSNALQPGMNSVLLRNLRGGQGITQLGTITVTDRAGKTADIDLSGASSLDDVIYALNNAQTIDGDKVNLEVTLNSQGTGLLISDTSGSTSGNLIIADTSNSSLAADLGIAINSSTDSVNSGSLGLRYVNEATSIDKLPADGTFTPGSIQITDAAGQVSVVTFSTSVKTIGDVITRINAAKGVNVEAKLNDTGDGFVLIDKSGGSGTLKVSEVNEGTTAADLKLLGTSVTGTDGKQRLNSRTAQVIDIKDTDTLTDIVAKINSAGKLSKASLFQDGSTLNPTRLNIQSRVSGAAGKLFIDDGGLGLGFSTIVEAQDAVLKYGTSESNSFLLTSSTNKFSNVVSGVSVTINQSMANSAEVSLTRDTSRSLTALQNFVEKFNTNVSTIKELTKYDADTEQRGILQGDTFTLGLESRLNSMVNKRFNFSGTSIHSLAEMGLYITTGGQLTLDEDKFQSVLNTKPDDVANFFLDADNGFGQYAETVVTNYTDVTTGTFKSQDDYYNNLAAKYQTQIDTLNTAITARKDRLITQFSATESIIGKLSGQQEYLTALQNSNSK
jgi:flagellar hook-associated protein 2